MPDAEETRIALARIEGMLSATLPQHAARLDEHDRALTNLAAIVTQQGQDIAAVKAVSTDRAAEQRTTPRWVGVAGAMLAAAAVLASVLIAILT